MPGGFTLAMWGIIGIGILVFLYFVRKSGKTAAENKQRKANEKANERVVDAREDAITDKSGLLDRLSGNKR